MNKHLFKITLNFLAVILLISLVATPLYFARNFAKVAGVKSESKFLVVSQVEKFPGMIFIQDGDNYKVSFIKQGTSQAYLGILIINNPTQHTQTYRIETNGSAELFFGEDLNYRQTQISVPASASVPVSLFSDEESTAEAQTVKFTIALDK